MRHTDVPLCCSPIGLEGPIGFLFRRTLLSDQTRQSISVHGPNSIDAAELINYIS